MNTVSARESVVETKMMRRATVMIADDHVAFTDGIVRILETRFDVVGTVTDGDLLVEAAARLHPDVIVMDISMPSVSGLEALRRLRTRPSDSKVIFLTLHSDPKLAAEAFRNGARGFVLKQSTGEELIAAIDAVLEGHKYLAAALTEGVLAPPVLLAAAGTYSYGCRFHGRSLRLRRQGSGGHARSGSADDSDRRRWTVLPTVAIVTLIVAVVAGFRAGPFASNAAGPRGAPTA
jgi:CheY-like chemotaxis protein